MGEEGEGGRDGDGVRGRGRGWEGEDGNGDGEESRVSARMGSWEVGTGSGRRRGEDVGATRVVAMRIHLAGRHSLVLVLAWVLVLRRKR